MSTNLCILGHLGLGDHLILNAIYRSAASFCGLVCIPVKHHNVPSVAFMLRDVENIVIRPVEDDEEAMMFYNKVWRGDKLGLGCFGDKFDGRQWDKSFYSQANLSFQLRWDGWKCERDIKTEAHRDFLAPPPLNWDLSELRHAREPWAFVHDDSSRGMVIAYKGFKIPPIIVRPSNLGHIFQWWSVVTLAPEIHCICSSFSLFIDSIDLPQNPRLFLHAYTRPGEPLPQFRHPWEIIQ